MPLSDNHSSPSYLVPRKATARTPGGRSTASALSNWRDRSAYVLLGDPGAGKTEAFVAEARDSAGYYISARNFLSLSPKAEWTAGSSLFIDGLDEVRAGATSAHSALDSIRSKLDALGRPRFRIACREADWLAALDATALQEVSPDGAITELRLEPLDDSDIMEILRRCDERVQSPDAFWHEAGRRHIQEVLRNPLLLQLVIDAVAGTAWPSSRTQTFDLACRRMISEHNLTHRSAKRRSRVPEIEPLLHDAGLACAVLLLAGQVGVSIQPTDKLDSYLPADQFSALIRAENLDFILSSKLFIADGDARVPRHRAVAEYLAGRAVARLCATDGLPVTRVLGMVSGFDGGIVEPLRGFHAWIAALCLPAQDLLITRDPLGIILYGDVRDFTASAKTRLLTALQQEATKFVWFRSSNWTAHPFGALGTTDMEREFCRLLQLPARDPVHCSLVDCVLDAIQYGDRLPQTVQPLMSMVRDASYPLGVRSSALDALLAQTADSEPYLVKLLDDIDSGAVSDETDDLAGKLLWALYPKHIAPSQAVRYLHEPKRSHHIGHYRLFWGVQFPKHTPAEALPDIADQLAELYRPSTKRPQVSELPRFVGQVIAGAIEQSGEQQESARLYKWLGTGMDDYGSARFERDEYTRIGQWLLAHPATLRRLIGYGFDQASSDVDQARLQLFSCLHRLCLPHFPPDWPVWLLAEAARTGHPTVAQFCVQAAAAEAATRNIAAREDFAYVEQWIEANRNRWPDASLWVEAEWSLPLEHWRGNQWKREGKQAARSSSQRSNRRKLVTEHFQAIAEGTASPDILRNIAHSYQGNFSDIKGATALDRVRDYLAGSEEEALAAIHGLRRALYRHDLPTAEDILRLSLERKEYLLGIACLTGAEIEYESNPKACETWSTELARTLIAFWLSNGVGDEPGWYVHLMQVNPALVAGVFNAYAAQRLKQNELQTATGVWQLSQDEGRSSFAKLVVPPLLEQFPLNASAEAVLVLDSSLLPSAAKCLSAPNAVAIANRRLANGELEVGQRISWLVFALTVSDEVSTRSILSTISSLISSDANLASVLSMVLERQSASSHMPRRAVSALIEMLAPRTSPAFPAEERTTVTDASRRRDLVRTFIQGLAASADPDATLELQRLRSISALSAWRTDLDGAVHEQGRLARMTAFKHVDSRHAIRALQNGGPANIRDLLALTVDHLLTLERHIRGDETNSLRLFWRSDGTRESPKVENDCRDILLTLLRPRLLPKEVSLEKEARAAQDKRCDLRSSSIVDAERLIVPLEIKKDDDAEVWTAWKTQLQELYSIDPSAGGSGIYLILWFNHKTQRAPNGKRPKTPEELGLLVRDTMPDEARRLIEVVTLDLSKPASKPPPRASLTRSESEKWCESAHRDRNVRAKPPAPTVLEKGSDRKHRQPS